MSFYWMTKTQKGRIVDQLLGKNSTEWQKLTKKDEFTASQYYWITVFTVKNILFEKNDFHSIEW